MDHTYEDTLREAEKDGLSVAYAPEKYDNRRPNRVWIAFSQSREEFPENYEAD